MWGTDFRYKFDYFSYFLSIVINFYFNQKNPKEAIQLYRKEIFTLA